MAEVSDFRHDLSDEGSVWRKRCEHWLVQGDPPNKPRGRRERNGEPLILCGHGSSLRVDKHTLLIRDGRTHYPQKPDEIRFFKGDLALPPRIILLGGSGAISFDALSWLSDQKIPLIRISGNGNVVAAVTASGYSADGKKVRWQIETRADEKRRIEFSADLVRQKLGNSIITLDKFIPRTASQQKAISKTKSALASLSDKPPEDVTALRTVEAHCAMAYFAAWKSLPLSWTATTRRPIPDDWRVFTSRTSLANGHKLKNVNASHPINALLNYAYTVLQGLLQIQAVADGYDPTIGIMHHGRREAPAFVFDVMEPMRPVVDRAILTLVQSERLHAVDFTIRSDGVCRLNPQLARRMAALVQGAMPLRDLPARSR